VVTQLPWVAREDDQEGIQGREKSPRVSAISDFRTPTIMKFIQNK